LGVNFDNKRILTSLIDVSTISPDELRICPCYFQQYIDKEYEVRANVIGNKVYACKIESQKSNLTKIDWRNYDIQNTPHELIILPQKINSACVDIVKQLNLNFGAIDLIVTPAGEYFFLECNSQAHWLWIEELIELPLTKYIVDSMINVGFS
ncbi:MAG: hypothetical protein H3C64_11155, partial [Candidatus Kuenenia stuttgartiensis]|nr:hypothetical protein [Candidatus Kuenenia stuttgartiensis]